MRKITEQGLQLIKDFEGYSSTLYICPAGYETIGYGHLVRQYERSRFEAISAVMGLSQREATVLLKEDVSSAERAVLRLITAPLTNGQFDALVDFTFNLGAGNLQSSTLRRVINRGDYNAAPEQFRRWVYSAGKKSRGLIRRREADIVLFVNHFLFNSK